MEKEFVPYEIALELKELGFDEPCRDHWERGTDGLGWGLFTSGEWLTNKELMTEYKDDEGNICGEFLAPLYQQAFRWFRDKYGLIGYIQTSYITNEVVNNRNIPCTPRIEFTFGITNTIGKSIFSSFKQGSFKTYEEVELECLKKLIEIVKIKNE